MSRKVTMNLSEDEIQLIQKLRTQLNLSTNTGTVGQSLRIASLISDGLAKGKHLAFVDDSGKQTAQLLIPGLSRSP